MKVIGVQFKKGNYQGTDYHNVLLHCTKKDGEAFGELTELVKVKFSEVQEVFGKALSSADWQNLIGKSIEYYCDKFGKVLKVNVITQEHNK